MPSFGSSAAVVATLTKIQNGKCHSRPDTQAVNNLFVISLHNPQTGPSIKSETGRRLLPQMRARVVGSWESDMAISWRNEMSVDGGIIDEDHKCLIELVNEVDLVKRGPMMLADLNTVLAKLTEYARVHFDREERLQVASAFTYAQAHRSRHRALLRELQNMIAACNATAPEKLSHFQLRLSEFLFHWLRDHIIKCDLLMKPFVAEMRMHAESAAPLRQVVHTLRDADSRSTGLIRQLPLPAAHAFPR